MNKKILKIKQYIHGVQPLNKKNIKFNTNENPYHTEINIIKKIIKEIYFFGNILKFYPDSDSNIIKNEIKKIYNIKKKNIFIGNGSDDVLANIFITFFKKKKLYLVDLTYSLYESFIKLYKIKYKLIKINKKFLIKIKKIKKTKNNLIINNPNAPTAKKINDVCIRIIIKNFKSLVLIDETYIDFESNSIIKKSFKKKNVLVVQTFSKYRSFAGMRVGFVIGNEKIIKKINITKSSLNSYPVNIISQISLKNITKNEIFFKKLKKKILKNKIQLKKNLKKINFKIIKSETNFILITKKNININKILWYLNKNNIFVRKFEIPKIENYLRITIGKKKDNEILLKKIKKITKLEK